jgi:5-methyltetrahydrofolate--homocysteine methyltransferase
MNLNTKFPHNALVKNNRVLVGDGAMGTLLQAKGLLRGGGCPENLNRTHPQEIIDIHRSFAEAGAQWLQTNTFGGSPFKLKAYGFEADTAELNARAVALAREAAPNLPVWGDIGPSGQLMIPLGTRTLDEMIAGFFVQAKALDNAGVDGFLIETMADLQEAKAAVMAVKALGPGRLIACSLTFEPGLRTLSGDDPETVAAVLQALGVHIIGANCGFGPESMVELITRFRAVSDRPLLVQPNAGLPILRNGETVFPSTPKEMAAYVPKLIAAGAHYVGGCCGTTPEHIKAMSQAAANLKPLPLKALEFSTLAGFGETVVLANHLPMRWIGERINPTARKKLAESLRAGAYESIAREAEEQIKAGASMIDLNVSLPTAPNSEAERLQLLTLACQRRIRAPLSLDTPHPANMESALKVMRGKPLLNSTNGDEEHLQAICQLAARYGAAILGLTLDRKGIPSSAEDRLVIARRIVQTAESFGIARNDIYIDGLTLTAGASQALVPETLRLIRMVKQELGVRTILGVSNVSHGLPLRPILNTAFLMMAMEAGLDAAIINPFQPDLALFCAAANVLTGRDANSKAFIALSQETEERPADFRNIKANLGNTSTLTNPTSSTTPSTQTQPNNNPNKITQLQNEILYGSKEQIEPLLKALLQEQMPPLEIVNTGILPALTEVGERYDRKVYFLPQLLLAAEAAKLALAFLQPYLKQEGATSAGTVVIATVQGDIHDIGKGIVGLLLQNHGFRVIDLGKDVANAQIIETAIAEKADLIALSSLMTTTLPQMGLLCQTLRTLGLEIPVLIGGAIVNEAYAQEIGAHYGADATDAVRLALKCLKKEVLPCSN